jgi:hypothetical protein
MENTSGTRSDPYLDIDRIEDAEQMNVAMRQGVRITTDSRGDAKCISDALIDYGSEVEEEGKRWTVQLSGPTAPELTAVLAALKICLDENAIALVTVTVDGQAYAMEGTASDPAEPASQTQGP